MTTNLIKLSQRKAAKVVGITIPLSIIIVMVVNLAIVAPLIIQGNSSATAQNILSHQFLFRIGIAGNILYSVCVVVILVALYIILKNVTQSLAIFAAICFLINSFSWLLIALNQFTVLRLLNDMDFSNAFHPDGLFAMVRLHLIGEDIYYAGLLFWALGSTAISYLLFKSKYIPKSLSAFGIVSSAWCVVCTFIFYIYPDYAKVVNLWWFDSPMVLFEIVMSFWLLFKGLKLSDKMEAHLSYAST
ncbi:MAG: DUF4386 domain-containing protein [Calditrichaeota bacterium]|nr:MAG: DUF4386 domain-containing protein [Calditrichota bacterium]